MDKLANVLKFKAQCPFLGSTKSSTLRTLCTRASPHYPSLTRLTEKATGCPVMGPILTSRSRQIAAGYASIAGNADVKKIHQDKGVDMEETSTVGIEKCPHASAALSAARMAQDLSNAQKVRSKVTEPVHTPATSTKPTGCPFHNATSQTTSTQPTEELFNYERFYGEELDKKRADNSYRYFNNINRMAQKFPLAHTGKVTDQVEVWCANDYLGMGNNPVVLETMQ
jgi:5-aminolevulinate synthase